MELKSSPFRGPGALGKRSLERRAAALIALLALEGPTSRSRLAGVLWPDVPETNARNNLSQTLRRLRQWGADVVIEGDAQLTLLTPLGEAAALVLLAAHDYNDLPDLRDLLVANNERRRTAQVRQVSADLNRAEAQGDLRTALDISDVLLDLDPLSEEAHRQAMRLRYLLSDQAGALAAYRRCQEVFQRELGVAPSAATQSLASEIRRSTGESPAEEGALPLSVQRPPRLIGRERAWVQMQRAWDEGKGIILCGEPGIGKTRLLQDFLAHAGQAAVFQGRPGDKLLPYSTHARSFSRLLRQFPELELPGWVRRELSRLVPELGEAQPAVSSDAEKLRFYQAMTEVLRLVAAAGLRVLAFDDLQFVDEASVEAGEHSLASFWGDTSTPLRTLHVYRSGKLSAEVEARIEALVSAGLAVRILLKRLDGPATETLLESLNVPLLAAHRHELSAASGGNPLLLLEASRHLLGSGRAETLPTRVGTWLGARIERLTPGAVQLARTAAILGPDLSAETAAEMLGVNALDLSPAWSELEEAQVLRGTDFIHDLLAEGILEGVPGALRELLHRRAAAALEPAGLAPARIAAHWAAGKELGRAAGWWLRAGEEAQRQYRYQAAAQLYEQAWQASQTPDAAFESGLKLARLLSENEPSERVHQIVDQLLASAQTPAQQAAASVAYCQLLGLEGNGAALEAAARQGLSWARQAPGQPGEVELTSFLGSGLFFQDKLDAALEVFRDTVRLAEDAQDLEEWCIALGNESGILVYLGRHTEAAGPLRRAEQLLAQSGRLEQRATVLTSLGNIDLFCGRVAAAGLAFATAQDLLDQVDSAAQDKLVVLLNRVGCARLRGEYALALELIQQALDQLQASSFLGPVFLMEQARLYQMMGADALARSALAQVDAARFLEVVRVRFLLLKALLDAQQGADPEGLLTSLNQEQQGQATPLSDQVAMALALGPLLSPVRCLELTEGLPEQALTAELLGQWLALLVCRVQALITLGKLEEAERAMEAVLHAPPEVTPSCSQAEVLFTHARLLEARHAADASKMLWAAREALLRAADLVPPEYRASFLRLPLNQAMLAASEPQTSGWAPLTDAQWQAVSALLEQGAGRGRPRRDGRAVLDAALWILATGRPWKELPPHFPAVSTVHRRFQQWRMGDTLRRVLQALEPLGGLPRSALARQVLSGDLGPF